MSRVLSGRLACVAPRTAASLPFEAGSSSRVGFSSSATSLFGGVKATPRNAGTFICTAGLRGASLGRRSWNSSYDGHSPDFNPYSRWDVLGLGQAIVDFSASVNDDFLNAVDVPKGGRRVISVSERGEILSNLDGDAYRVNAGGSLSNTLVALARLGRADAQLRGVPPLRVALGGHIGRDALGEFYRAKVEKAGVEFTSEPESNSTTGTVVVLTTPDAQRSFLSYPGSAHDLLKDVTSQAISNCRILVIEGYLWEIPGAWEGIRHAIVAAREAGTLVVMSAGDAGVVQRHRDQMMKAIELGVDVMFTNAAEASALMGVVGDCVDEVAMMLASHTTMAVVTDGSHGAYVAGLGRVEHIAPHWAAEKPVDTCGAGDAYAAGVLYGLLQGFDIQSMGRFGARVASAVISRHGARLKKEDALHLIEDVAACDVQGALLPPSCDTGVVVPAKMSLGTFRLRSSRVQQ